MGEVYKARDLNLDRFVALKFLKGELLSDEESRLRFKNEAKIIPTLDHPNIAAIYEIVEIDDLFFISMGYYEGDTLEKRLEAGPLSFDDIYSVGKQISFGLAEAHDAGIIHRDIKPGNIIITKKDQVKILDFGLAKSFQYTKITRRDVLLGTFASMSPEQVEAQPVDHRSDIFSFGTLLYTLITGENPFSGEYEVSIIYSILNEEPPAIRELRPDTPELLENLVYKALAKEPEERFQSAREIGSLFEKLQTGETSGAEIVRPKHKFSLLRSSWRIIASVAFLLTAVVLFLVFRPTDQLRGVENSIAVMPFRYEGEESDWQWLGAAASELINNELEHYPGLRRLGSKNRQKMIRDLGFSESGLSIEQSVQVARRSEIRLVLVGTLKKDGNTLRVETKVINAENNTLLAVIGPLEYNYSKLNELASHISQKLVRTFFAGSLAESAARATAEPMPVSLDALRYYIEGQAAAYDLRSKEAISRLTRAISLDSTFIRSYYLLSWQYRNIGEKVRAKEILVKGKPFIDNLSLEAKLEYLNFEAQIDRRWQDQIVYLEQWLRINPYKASLHSTYGQIQYNIFRNLDAGIAAMQKGLQLDSTDSYTYWHLAYAYLGKGDKVQALSMIDKYIRLNPMAASPLTAKAGILNHIGEYDSAVSLCERILAMRSESSSANLSLAKAYAALGKFSRAHEVLDTLRQLDLNRKDRSEYRARQARVFYQQTKYEQALQLVEQAMTLDSSNVEAHWLRGRSLLKLKDEKALTKQVNLLSLALDKKANVLKDRWFLYHLEGEIALQQRDLEAAIEWFQKAVNLGPKERDLYLVSLADAHAQAGQVQKAVEAYHSALDFNPNNALSNYQLAQLYETLGRPDEALQYYRNVASVWSDADDILPVLEISRNKIKLL